MRTRLKTWRSRMRTWWRSLPLMRVFACYTVACVVASGIASVLVIEVLMEAYDHLDAAYNTARPEVDGGPYIYDAATDDLVPAITIDLGNGFGDRVLFLGLRGGVGRASVEGGGVDGDQYVETIDAATERPVVYATRELLEEDPATTIRDWGANYTEADRIAAGGNPYDPDPIAVADLAAYDARERSERAQVTDALDGAIAMLDAADDGIVLSNVGYYVAQSSAGTETAVMLGLRLAAGCAPFIVMGLSAVATFRRFYRMRLAEPLATLSAAADRIAGRDLDFHVGAVRGRELGALAAVLEHMRASLERAQRRLMETAEEHRRLNAAFAHDLRTPVTVLKGTVEMMAADADPAEERRVAVLAGQVERLEAYAQAMTGVTKLEDRPVARRAISLAELADDLGRSARVLAERDGVSCALEVRDDAAAPREAGSADDAAAPAPALWVDAALVDEVLGNLMTNACRFARTSVRVQVRLRDDAGGARLELAVADDGPGFTGEALRRGCEAFYSEQKSAEHFGLGLTVAATLARLHGGSLELANAAEGGAVATASFDVGKPAGESPDGEDDQDGR